VLRCANAASVIDIVIIARTTLRTARSLFKTDHILQMEGAQRNGPDEAPQRNSTAG
jgi:hypothetical protein